MTILFKNYILISALISWFTAQFLKVFTGAYHNKRFSVIKLISSSGGMPSSHSAAVSALCTASVLRYGVSSFQFAVTFILALIVMRDAAGIRNQVGKQAKIINQMNESNCADLKELIGHTPFQVCMGSFLGVATALCLRLLY